MCCCVFFFFFQAEDGIRDYKVTGVQTCALPICVCRRDRQGRFRTEVFEQYQRSEKALVGTLAEMYLHGVSTRKVKETTEPDGLGWSLNADGGLAKVKIY